MSLNFIIPELHIGGAGTPPLQFFKKGFQIGPSGSPTPSWQDVILKGSTALTLVNAKANSLQYLKLYGGLYQDDTPTPTSPVDIVCNNGTLKLVDDELPTGYKRVLGYTCNNNVLWQITNFKLRGSDTVRISFSVSAACNVFGCYQGADANDNYDLYVSTTSGSKYLRYGSGTYLSYWSSANLDKRFDVVFSPNGTSGMPTDSTWSPLEFEAVNDLLIGSTTLTGTSSKLKGDLYGNIIVDNRLKLIPCERASDGSLGYYDTYSETFFEPTGTPTSMGYDVSHCEVIVDGTTETVQVHGINIFDKNDTENIGGWYAGSNQTITQANANETLVMRAKPNTTYYFKHCSVKGGCRAFYTEVEDWEIGSACSTMSGNAGANANAVYSITTSANAKWIFFNCGRNNVEASFDDQRNDFMVSTSELTSDTPYEAYYNGGTATATDLFGIYNTARYYLDEQEVKTGHIIRNTKAVVLTGNEDSWNTSSTSYCYALKIDDCSAYTSKIYCTHFQATNVNIADMPQYSVKTVKMSSSDISGSIFFKTSSTYNSLTAFKNFVRNQAESGTPIICVYPLIESETETVTAQNINIQAGTNIVEITQASIDGLELEVKYKAGVSVTIEEVENAQLSNDVTVTIL